MRNLYRRWAEFMEADSWDELMTVAARGGAGQGGGMSGSSMSGPAVGTRVVLGTGAEVEIVSNPGDGVWVFARYVLRRRSGVGGRGGDDLRAGCGGGAVRSVAWRDPVTSSGSMLSCWSLGPALAKARGKAPALMVRRNDTRAPRTGRSAHGPWRAADDHHAVAGLDLRGAVRRVIASPSRRLSCTMKNATFACCSTCSIVWPRSGCRAPP